MFEKLRYYKKSSGKCDNQQEYKAIVKAAIVSTPEVIAENIPLNMGRLGTTKKSSARKSLSPFFALLDVKQKTVVRILGASKTKCKAIRTISSLWYSINNQIWYTKTKASVKQVL